MPRRQVSNDSHVRNEHDKLRINCIKEMTYAQAGVGLALEQAAREVKKTGISSVAQQSRKKGCKKSKCSHWKGGKCKCGRD